MDWKTILFEKNEADWDRALRALLGMVCLVALGMRWVSGVAFWLAAVAAAILFYTALSGHCSAYPLLGFRTLKKRIRGAS
ncbi:MAG: DUF2892 domain-containing protein [Candidatus Diapherotrites archaeon]|nr:DUF2892 domain-containing protein [Candidatus Diapherotrites archaeon]